MRLPGVAIASSPPWRAHDIITSSGSSSSSGRRPRRRASSTTCAAAAAGPPPGIVLGSTAIGAGQLSLQLLQQDDVQGAGLLLTRAFAGTQSVKLQEAMQFMQQHAASGSDGLTLVARLVPTDASLLPPNKPSRLVGCVSLSFAGASQADAGSLPPPPGATYLANMAVDPKFRRQGIARAMLAACNQLAAAAAQQHPAAGDASSSAVGAATQQPEVWLHVRQDDPAALALYQGAGFAEVARDPAASGGWLLLGGGGGNQAAAPRILMRRRL